MATWKMHAQKCFIIAKQSRADNKTHFEATDTETFQLAHAFLTSSLSQFQLDNNINLAVTLYISLVLKVTPVA